MAKVVKRTKRQTTVIVTLSEKEAEVLYFVLRLIGGSNETPRKHTNEISEALYEAGIEQKEYQLDSGVANRIYFAEPR